MEKTITLMIEGKPFRFEMTPEAYNAFFDATTVPGNASVPAHNYLMRTINDEGKEALKEILKQPGAGVQITTQLNNQYVPKLAIAVGE